MWLCSSRITLCSCFFCMLCSLVLPAASARAYLNVMSFLATG
jgi:hypothetical protein